MHEISKPDFSIWENLRNVVRACEDGDWTPGLVVWALTVLALSGCDGHTTPPENPMGLVVYVDLKTQAPVVQLATDVVPAVHPETGRRTLMPGLYCSACQRWHPTPTFETLQRTPGAALCPKHGTPLTTDGPWPKGDER